jgi:hypothetical protein
MPPAEINVPGLILVGRFSSDPHWPFWVTPEAASSGISKDIKGGALD